MTSNQCLAKCDEFAKDILWAVQTEDDEDFMSLMQRVEPKLTEVYKLSEHIEKDQQLQESVALLHNAVIMTGTVETQREVARINAGKYLLHRR